MPIAVELVIIRGLTPTETGAYPVGMTEGARPGPGEEGYVPTAAELTAAAILAAGPGGAAAPPAKPRAKSIWDVLAVSEKVEIHRKASDGQTGAYCGRHDKSKFEEDPDFIGREFGGGLYRVQGVNAKGKYHEDQYVEMEYDKVAFFKKLEPPAPKPGADPTVSALGVLVPLFAALAPPRVDPLQQMTMMLQLAREMNPQPTARANDSEAMLSTFLKGMEIAATMNPNGKSLDWGQVMKSIEGVVGRGLDTWERVALQPAWDPVTRKLVTRQPAQLPAPAQPHPSGNGKPKPPAEVVQLVAIIKERAAANMDHEQAANEIVGHVPPIAYGKFLKFLYAPDTFARIVDVDPDMSKFQEWFDKTWAFAVKIGDALKEGGYKPDEPDAPLTSTQPTAKAAPG